VGGTALAKASKAIENFSSSNKDKELGAKIVYNACKYPLKQIAYNAGYEGTLVLEKVYENQDKNYGFDAGAGEYKEMVKAGIIDPTKVVRTALQNAASAAGTMLTAEALIAELPEKKDKAPTPTDMPPDFD